MIDVVLEYESRRSGQPKSAVLAEGRRIVDVIRNSMDKSIEVNNLLIGGLASTASAKEIQRFWRNRLQALP